MLRTQIQLEEEQHRKLKAWARERGISLSEAVRRCVAARLAEDEALRSPDEGILEAFSVIGKYADPDGASEVAGDHDAHLAEAFRS